MIFEWNAAYYLYINKPRILSLFPNSFNKVNKHEHSCKILYIYSVSSLVKTNIIYVGSVRVYNKKNKREYRDHTCFFHALTFAGSRGRGCCFNTRPIGRVFKHLPSDPASVNAMKQTCVIVTLAYFTLFQPNSH